MSFPRVFAACVAACLSLPLAANAQLVIIGTDTSNTGQDGSGNLIASGSPDPIWQFVGYDNTYGFNNISYAPVTSGATPNPVPSATTVTTGAVVAVSQEAAYVVQNPPVPAWAPPTTNTEYISANPNQAKGGMPGVYMYQFSFDSPISGTVTFSGVASADNGLAIIYNGVTEKTFGGQLVLSTNPLWTPTTNLNTPPGGSVYGAGAAPFNFSAPITAGTNTIDFDVSNFNDAAYSGDEEGLYVTNFLITVPEPRDYALYFLGATIGLMLLHRGRRLIGTLPSTP
jgi:hypothetical protein